MTETLETRLSEALKETTLPEPVEPLTGHQLEVLARSRQRRRRTMTLAASGVAVAMAVIVGLGMSRLTDDDRGAGPAAGSPSSDPPTSTGQTTDMGFGPGPPPLIAPLNLIWPNGQRPPHGQIDAVVGRPVTLRARLVLPGQSARSLTWIQLLVMNPHARVGVPWPAGSLAHQPARSARIFGADATSGQRVTLTWTPNRPGRYRVSYVERLGHGAGWGSPATILVRPAA